MKSFGVCIPLARGSFYGSFLPKPVKNTVVVGDPIILEEVGDRDNITTEELDRAHNLYMQKISELFEENKGMLGYGDRVLQIV